MLVVLVVVSLRVVGIVGIVGIVVVSGGVVVFVAGGSRIVAVPCFFPKSKLSTSRLARCVLSISM